MAMAASALPTCRIADRCSACRPASMAGSPPTRQALTPADFEPPAGGGRCGRGPAGRHRDDAEAVAGGPARGCSRSRGSPPIRWRRAPRSGPTTSCWPRIGPSRPRSSPSTDVADGSRCADRDGPRGRPRPLSCTPLRPRSQPPALAGALCLQCRDRLGSRPYPHAVARRDPAAMVARRDVGGTAGPTAIRSPMRCLPRSGPWPAGRCLRDILEARIFDLYDDPMPSRTDLEGYCGETASAVIQLAAMVLDATRRRPSRDLPAMRDAPRQSPASWRGCLLHRARRQCFVPRDLLEAAGTTPKASCPAPRRMPQRGRWPRWRRWDASTSGPLPMAERACRGRSGPPSCRWRPPTRCWSGSSGGRRLH